MSMPEYYSLLKARLNSRLYQVHSNQEGEVSGLLIASRVITILLLVFLFIGTPLSGQSVGDYRTNGNAQFNTAANWQVYNGTAWVAAAVDPALPSGVITIRNGHTATVFSSETLDQLIVEAGGVLRINNSRNLVIGNGAEAFDLEVYGTVENYNIINTTANPGSAVRFHDNSLYNHRLNGGTIPEATWLTNSTCAIMGVTSILPSGLNQVFGNLTWTCPTQTDDIDINSDLEVRGTFTMANTGSRYLRVATSGSYTMNLGSYAQTGGRLNLATGGFTCTFNLTGDFSFSGGSFLTSGSGIGNINFRGPGIQTFNRTGGSFSNTRINYTVFSGAILDMGTSIIDVSGSFIAAGTFTLNDGGGLMLGDPYGITSTTTGTTGGNIRVIGTRSFSSNADYTYNGSVAQVTGDALPSTVRDLTVDNSTGVSLTGDLTVSRILTMNHGNITTSGNDFILSNSVASSLVYSDGTIIGAFERYVSEIGINYLFPVGSVARAQSLTSYFIDLASGSLLVQFIEGDPGNAGLPIDDAGSYTITNQYTTGYWFTQAKNSLSSDDFRVDLDASGFGPYPVSDGTRVIRRNDTGNWTLDGVHAGLTGSVVSRSGMIQTINPGSGGTHFCIGKTGPRITSQPADKTVCQGTSDPSIFQTEAVGYGTLNYQWYKAPGHELTNDGHYVGVATSVLGINNVTAADAGDYLCTVTDGRGESTETIHAHLNVPSVSFGFNYFAELSISQAYGTGNLNDFPLLVNISRDFLRSVGNGGHVINPNGFDIVFADNNSQILNHEVESYDPLTGNLVAWVRIPELSSSGTTTIRILYGNPAITTDQSTEDTWISSYKAVWHLSNNSLNDATSYNNDLTNSGTSSTIGLIEEARSFDGANDYVRSVTTNGIGGNSYNQTIGVWALYTTLPDETQNLMVLQRAGSTSAVQIGFREVGGTYRVVVWNWGGAPLVWSNSLPSPNAWHYFTYTFDGSNHRLYIDGIEAGSSTTATTQSAVPQYVYLGSYSGGEYFSGLIDEARYSLSQKTAAWIETEYHNQVEPGSFVSVGGEQEMMNMVSAGLCNAPVALNGYPAGGTFSGPGISGNVFDPAIAGSGTHTITYTHLVDGCSVSLSENIAVTPVPGAPLTGDEFCCVRNVEDLDATGRNLTWYSNPGLTSIAGWGTPFASGRTTTGTYTYYVTQTVNGCESAAATAVLTIYPNTPVGGTASVGRTPECLGNTAVFTLTGHTGRVIGWQKKLASDTEWTNIDGSNVNPYSEILTVSGSWQYRAVVSVGLCGTVYSSVVNISVIEDVTGPVISGCPANFIVYTGPANPDCSQIANWIEPTAIDYCEGSVSFTSRSHAPGSVFSVGTTTVTYTFTDGVNVSTCMFDVTVVDNTIPTITCAIPAVSYVADAGECYYSVPGVALDPTYTNDNCGVQGFVNDFTGTGTLSGAQFPVGTTSVTWTITDIHGFTGICNQTITVIDAQAPAWSTETGALDITLQCNNAAGLATAQSLAPVATDNCDVTLTPVKTTGAFVPGTCPEAGTYTNTWTVNDDSGNISAVYSQTITIIDTQAPTWTTAEGALNVTLECSDAAGLATAQSQAPVATDNCDRVVCSWRLS